MLSLVFQAVWLGLFDACHSRMWGHLGLLRPLYDVSDESIPSLWIEHTLCWYALVPWKGEFCLVSISLHHKCCSWGMASHLSSCWMMRLDCWPIWESGWYLVPTSRTSLWWIWLHFGIESRWYTPSWPSWQTAPHICSTFTGPTSWSSPSLSAQKPPRPSMPRSDTEW